MKQPGFFHSMKSSFLLPAALALALAGLVPPASQAETFSRIHPDYFVLKGGFYYPSERFNLDDFTSGNRAGLSKRKGINAEIAWGRYFFPFFGMEFGVGYFESRQFADVTAGRLKLEALPVLLSAKVSLPLGPLEPYGEVGVGAYFWKSEIEGIFGKLITNRDTDFGPHAGAGVNINLTDAVFLGLEGRYRRVKTDIGQNIRLNGYTATINVGFRY